MKKVYALLGALVVLIAVGVWYVLSFGFERANFTSELAKYLNQGLEQQTLAAEYRGERFELDSGSVDGLLRVLQRGKTEYEDAAMPAQYDDVIVLYLGDLTMRVYQPDEKIDTVVVERELRGRSIYQSLSGYKTSKWLKDTIGIPLE